jgi:hypothetical protein
MEGKKNQSVTGKLYILRRLEPAIHITAVVIN